MPYRIDHTNTSNNHQRNNRHLWHQRNNRRLSAAGSSESIVTYDTHEPTTPTYQQQGSSETIVTYDTSETIVTYQQQSAGHTLLSFFSYLQQLSII